MFSLERIAGQKLATLTENEKELYQTILTHKQDIPSMKINDLVELSFCSKSAILRFVQKLGFKGFADFKYSIDWQSDEKEIAQDSLLVQVVANLLNSLDEEKIEKLSLLIQDKALFMASTSENQHNVMEHFQNLLMKKGKNAYTFRLGTTESTKIMLSSLDETSFLLVFSATGESENLKASISPLLERNIPVVSFSTYAGGWLEEQADLSFSLDFTRQQSELFPYSSGLNHLLIDVIAQKLNL